MNQKELIVRLYEDWYEMQDDSYPTGDSIDKHYNEKEKRAIFLCDELLGLVTYDDSLSLYYGNMVIETMRHIRNKTTFQYIENEENYRKYILSCNYIITMLEWGTSIRGAWFDTSWNGRLKIEVGGHILEQGEVELKFDEEFLVWFLDFLQAKNEIKKEA